ncbi:hypothetical protein CHARACLAT_026450 [Characodon lateralis]|uniref:Uncharacterized protein n=1 Tax=Characodon lateralis TaxID=208331 RepID=A0ABU7F045_9TELE|nr:hypothetical protein [Characodon lateralis]
MLYTHSHSPYILYTLRSRYRYPRGATSPRIPGGGPLPSGMETSRLPQHQSRLMPALLEPGRPQTPTPSSDQPPTTPVPVRKWGHAQKMGLPGPNEPANQSHPRMKQSQPPNDF